MKGNSMARIGLTCYALLVWGSLSFAQRAAVPPQPLEIEGALSRVYKSIEGSELRLHIFTPKNRGTATALPAIVFFFGGGWMPIQARFVLHKTSHAIQVQKALYRTVVACLLVRAEAHKRAILCIDN